MEFHPRVLTERRGCLVSNRALAQLCALSGLHRYMRYTLASVRIAVGAFIKQSEMERQKGSGDGVAGDGAGAADVVGGPTDEEAFTAWARPGWSKRKKSKRKKQRRSQSPDDVDRANGLQWREPDNGVRGDDTVGGVSGATAVQGGGWGVIGNAGKKQLPPSSSQAAGTRACNGGGSLDAAALADGPKLLADLVEAVLGAVLIDSGGDLTAVWGAYKGLVKAARGRIG